MNETAQKNKSSVRLLSIGLAIFIVLGLGILAIDKFVVKRNAPSTDERLTALMTEFNLQEPGSEERDQLLECLQGVSAINDIDTVLFREDDVHRLWLFEYAQSGKAFHAINRQEKQVDVTLFGVLIELTGEVALPSWTQQSDKLPPIPPHTLESIGVLGRLNDYQVGMKDKVIFLTTSIDGWALQQTIENQTSVEFHAGLYNSAMKVDVQSAVNLVNAMDTGAAPIPDFYKISIPEIKIEFSRDTGISNRLTTIREEAHAKLKADQAQSDAKFKKIREEQEAKMKAIREKMAERLSAERPSKASEVE